MPDLTYLDTCFNSEGIQYLQRFRSIYKDLERSCLTQPPQQLDMCESAKASSETHILISNCITNHTKLHGAIPPHDAYYCYIQALKKSKDEYVPLCRVPVVTSSKEEQLLVSTSKKPVVKLSCNRHNNKYSYTRYVCCYDCLFP